MKFWTHAFCIIFRMTWGTTRHPARHLCVSHKATKDTEDKNSAFDHLCAFPLCSLWLCVGHGRFSSTSVSHTKPQRTQRIKTLLLIISVPFLCVLCGSVWDMTSLNRESAKITLGFASLHFCTPLCGSVIWLSWLLHAISCGLTDQ